MRHQRWAVRRERWAAVLQAESSEQVCLAPGAALGHNGRRPQPQGLFPRHFCHIGSRGSHENCDSVQRLPTAICCRRQTCWKESPLHLRRDDIDRGSACRGGLAPSRRSFWKYSQWWAGHRFPAGAHGCWHAWRDASATGLGPAGVWPASLCPTRLGAAARI